MTTYKNKEVVDCREAKAWRSWLSQNYAQEEGIWLVLYKKGSTDYDMSYEDARNQALCFGWIDSKSNKKDDQSWYQYFAPRNPKSNWSKVNKMVIEQLLLNKQMEEPGIKMVKLAKKSGTWDALNDVDNLVVPEDLQEAFDESPKA